MKMKNILVEYRNVNQIQINKCKNPPNKIYHKNNYK